MNRIALGVSYDGAALHGWQTQANQPNATAQEQLEKALSSVANEPIHLFCAGRTDAGVHATGQVVHFDTAAIRPDRAWIRGVNSQLSDAVAVNWMKPVSQDFHARFSALSRCYRYLIQTGTARPALFRRQLAWQYRDLDAAAMHEAAQSLLGEQDFTSFRASGCQSNTPMRNVMAVAVRQVNPHLVMIEITANAFLYHMVRNIAGSLLEVGLGQQPRSWIKLLLRQKNRDLAAPTASASGLYLVQVDYPQQFGLPITHKGPILLAQ